MLDCVLENLRNEFVDHGPEHFERLKVFVLGRSDAPYAVLGSELNTSEGALKVVIHRLRKRYRELFRQEIADTVADPARRWKPNSDIWRPYSRGSSGRELHRN